MPNPLRRPSVLQCYALAARSALLAILLALGACQSAYYSAWETLGVHKRDILGDRVEAAQESQREGQEQFKSALEQFKAVVAVNGGELETRYEELNREYEASLAAAEEIRDRIEAVDAVAKALFSEWSEELDEYTNDRLKADSSRRLKETEQRYQRLIQAMRSAERSIEPVLSTLRDHVLYLKHNLNARAIASLKGEVQSIDADVQTLLATMQQSIREADAFLAELKDGQ